MQMSFNQDEVIAFYTGELLRERAFWEGQTLELHERPAVVTDVIWNIRTYLPGAEPPQPVAPDMVLILNFGGGRKGTIDPFALPRVVERPKPFKAGVS